MQLRLCPTKERAAIVDKTVLTNSFRNWRQFLGNSALRYTLFTLSKGCCQPFSLQNVFLVDASKTQMPGQHIYFRFFNHRQAEADFDFLQLAQNKPWKSSKAQIAIVGPPSYQISEIVSNKITATMNKLSHKPVLPPTEWGANEEWYEKFPSFPRYHSMLNKLRVIQKTSQLDPRKLRNEQGVLLEVCFDIPSGTETGSNTEIS